MKFEDYRIILYRQDEGSWVAEIPSMPSCYALMETREEALAGLAQVFKMIEESDGERGMALPAASTEIVNA
jgi:predicted RNase H-like HicB family nuclease